MAAWHLAPDRLKIAARLHVALQDCVRGLDHCSYYTGADDECIIVTQPYDDCFESLKIGLRLGNKMAPEIIRATEWGFHFPDNAYLFILKFPHGYLEELEEYREKIKNGRRTL